MIDPILRGIYYLYLNDGAPESIKDTEALYELASVWHHAIKRDNWTTSVCCLWKDRDLFVRELIQRGMRGFIGEHSSDRS